MLAKVLAPRLHEEAKILWSSVHLILSLACYRTNLSMKCSCTKKMAFAVTSVKP